MYYSSYNIVNNRKQVREALGEIYENILPKEIGLKKSSVEETAYQPKLEWVSDNHIIRTGGSFAVRSFIPNKIDYKPIPS